MKIQFVIFLLTIWSSMQTPGLNIITEYVMGLIYPGRPIANVCFKTYGYMSMAQAVSFLSDFKLGHYMKIPPRSMFLVQVLFSSQPSASQNKQTSFLLPTSQNKGTSVGLPWSDTHLFCTRRTNYLIWPLMVKAYDLLRNELSKMKC